MAPSGPSKVRAWHGVAVVASALDANVRALPARGPERAPPGGVVTIADRLAVPDGLATGEEVLGRILGPVLALAVALALLGLVVATSMFEFAFLALDLLFSLLQTVRQLGHHLVVGRSGGHKGRNTRRSGRR